MLICFQQKEKLRLHFPKRSVLLFPPPLSTLVPPALPHHGCMQGCVVGQVREVICFSLQCTVLLCFQQSQSRAIESAAELLLRGWSGSGACPVNSRRNTHIWVTQISSGAIAQRALQFVTVVLLSNLFNLSKSQPSAAQVFYSQFICYKG